MTDSAHDTGPRAMPAFDALLPPHMAERAEETGARKAALDFPALEFVSPIKGPSLEQICVAVGTGQMDAATAAADYDEDVKKQAQQLGIPGWE